MSNTTIQLSKEMKEKIGSWGSKNETYDVILRRIYALAVKEQLRDFLMSSEGCVLAKDALERAQKKWQK